MSTGLLEVILDLRLHTCTGVKLPYTESDYWFIKDSQHCSLPSVFQLHRSHVETSTTSSSSSPPKTTRRRPKSSPPFCTSSLNQTLDDLLAGVLVHEKDILKPRQNRSILSGMPNVPVDLDVSDGETSLSDSGSDSPVCVELPQQPTVYQHTVSNVRAELSWTGPCNGDLVSFYELRLQEAKQTGQHNIIKWFCSQTEEHLENLTPGTQYLFRVRALNVAGTGKWSEPYKFATMPAVPGLALDPSPVIAIVRRHRKPQKKTVFLPAS
ncbi:fibronectin type III domain-containing protein 8 [Sphaerodactylus townsendi]|uniref:fibronectin type III domain-containing protein 8 n=1 Tax=Sphaerodactylus townsendi TaxID=933632 RepID=UPI0020266594|nr:fibronectin type III domain-containing protein 8 [Sphaerodactylus townsendi]